MTYYINKILILDIVAAYIIDLIVGDPYWLPHPVRFIGYLISKTETVLRNIIERIIKKKGIYRKSVEKASKIKSSERTQRTENLNYSVNINKIQKNGRHSRRNISTCSCFSYIPGCFSYT
jgi:hypothetical protein